MSEPVTGKITHIGPFDDDEYRLSKLDARLKSISERLEKVLKEVRELKEREE